MVKGASAKRSLISWRAGGKKHPVWPGAAYRAVSTNSESPYWRRGVVLLQDPLDLFGMPLQIVRLAPSHGGPPDDLVEVPMFSPDHYGCGLDVHVAQARWQKLMNMSADALIGSMISFPKVCNATFSAATKTS